VDADLSRFGTEIESGEALVGHFPAGSGTQNSSLVARPISRTKVTPPSFTQYDQWGQRIDFLHTSEGWRELKAIAQKEGIPGIFYERKYGEHSRAYGFAKVLLMVGDSQEVCTSSTLRRVSTEIYLSKFTLGLLSSEHD
jgi:hypothetical protein